MTAPGPETPASAKAPRAVLYRGRVMHRRLRPRAHRLTSPVAMLLTDLPEHGPFAARHGLLGFDRAAPISLWQRDHGDGSGDLRHFVTRALRDGGYGEPGRITLLAMPRILGHAFNPISLFYCHDRAGRLNAVLHQVNNTFGQRHFYLLPATSGAAITQATAKNFHVSPFLPMDLAYRFRLTPPAATLAIGITVRDAAGTLLTAAYGATRQAASQAALAKLLLSTPLQGARVLLSIHWEAAKLWLKGLRFHRSPAPPRHSISVGH